MSARRAAQPRPIDAQRDGAPARLDTSSQVIELYESADANGSKIGVRFEVNVTRR